MKHLEASSEALSRNHGTQPRECGHAGFPGSRRGNSQQSALTQPSTSKPSEKHHTETMAPNCSSVALRDPNTGDKATHGKAPCETRQKCKTFGGAPGVMFVPARFRMEVEVC